MRPRKHLIRGLRRGGSGGGEGLNRRGLGLKRRNLGQTEASVPLPNQREILIDKPESLFSRLARRVPPALD